MNRMSYQTLRTISISSCCTSTWAAAETLGLGHTLVSVGWLDWAVVLILSMSFGLVSLLQRFKSLEPGGRWGLFVSAHMTGAIISGVTFYLLTQSLDDINRFLQAVVIGSAGWGGSKGADWAADNLLKWADRKLGGPGVGPTSNGNGAPP